MELVTVNGRHLPIKDDEEKKKRQIEFNKKEAESRNNAGGGPKRKHLSKKFDKLNNLKTKSGSNDKKRKKK